MDVKVLGLNRVPAQARVNTNAAWDLGEEEQGKQADGDEGIEGQRDRVAES
jgi:hypothetical protein